MSKYDPKNYPNRNFLPAEHQKLVDLLLRRLVELERRSHPAEGKATAVDKDLAAFSALKCAGALVKALAGWAIDHQTGLALAGLSYEPLQPSGTRKHPEYLAAKARVDNHEHEWAGGRAIKKILTPIMIRHLLLNLLRTGVLPAPLIGVQNEIEALDFGERGRIFEPVKTKEKVRLSEMRLQVEALCFVEFRVQRGLKKRTAQNEVATALRVSLPTLRSWDYRLRRQKLGSLGVERKLSFTRNAASFPRGHSLAHRAEEEYGDTGLKTFADRYRQAKRERTR